MVQPILKLPCLHLPRTFHPTCAELQLRLVWSYWQLPRRKRRQELYSKRWGKIWWQFNAVYEFDMIWGIFTLVFGEDVANLMMSIQSSWVSGHHGFMICYKYLF